MKIEYLSTCYIENEEEKPFTSDKVWYSRDGKRLNCSIDMFNDCYVDDQLYRIKIPANTESDGTSFALWRASSKVAGKTHDAGFGNQVEIYKSVNVNGGFVWEKIHPSTFPFNSRKFWDVLFREILLHFHKMAKWKVFILYKGVRIFGGKYFKLR